MFPQIASVSMLYLTISSLKLLDTHPSLVVMNLAFGLPLVTWAPFTWSPTSGAACVVAMGLPAFIATWNEFIIGLAFTSTITISSSPLASPTSKISTTSPGRSCGCLGGG